MMTFEEMEKWEAVSYRMRAEGLHYCFKSYSRFEEIEDPEFHRLRNEYLKSAKAIEDYVNGKLQEDCDLGEEDL